MIVVDTSAILAIKWGEPEAQAFSRTIFDAGLVLISTATRLECYIVALKRFGSAEAHEVEHLLSTFSIVTAPFDEAQFVLAKEAFERFGRGRFGLNYGDCFSYALAKSRSLPLLYKGDDFRLTDIAAAFDA